MWQSQGSDADSQARAFYFKSLLPIVSFLKILKYKQKFDWKKGTDKMLFSFLERIEYYTKIL